jgi:hypothetical protein
MSLIEPKLAAIWARIVAYKVFIVAGLLVLVLLFVAWYVQSCRNANFEKKRDEIKSNVSTINGEIKVLTNEKTSQTGEVNKTAGNVQNALNKAETIRNANYANTGKTEAQRKMCAAYPESIECQ